MTTELLAQIRQLASDHAARKSAAHFSGQQPKKRRARRPNTSEFTCNRKEAYTFEMARLVCFRIRDHQHRVVRAFKCHVCGWWHVGSRS